MQLKVFCTSEALLEKYLSDKAFTFRGFGAISTKDGAATINVALAVSHHVRLFFSLNSEQKKFLPACIPTGDDDPVWKERWGFIRAPKQKRKNNETCAYFISSRIVPSAHVKVEVGQGPIWASKRENQLLTDAYLNPLSQRLPEHIVVPPLLSYSGPMPRVYAPDQPDSTASTTTTTTTTSTTTPSTTTTTHLLLVLLMQG